MTEDPGLVAVGIAEALGRHSLGDVTSLLFGGPAVDDRAVLMAACQFLWDLANAHGQKAGRSPGEILAELPRRARAGNRAAPSSGYGSATSVSGDDFPANVASESLAESRGQTTRYRAAAFWRVPKRAL